MSLLISCWFLSFICLFSAVLLVGAGRCFQQYNFPRPQFCAVIVCMVQLCLGSFLCMCFSWKAGLSWNVSLPVTKAPSVFGGKGWSIEEAVAFWEVAFHWLPYGVTEGKLLCTDVCLFVCYLFFFFVFLFLATPSLFLHFLLFLDFSLKKMCVTSVSFGRCPQGCCEVGKRWGESGEGIWPLGPSLQRLHGIAPVRRERGPFGWFLWWFLGQGPCGCWGTWPKIHWCPRENPCFHGTLVSGQEGKLGKDSHPPMCGQEEGKRGQTGRKEADWSGVAWATPSLPFFSSSPHRPPQARVGARPWRQVNNPAQAGAVQHCLPLDICNWTGLPLSLDNAIQGGTKSHRPWSRS